MSAHIYRGSSVIRMIIRNPPWRNRDPQGIPTLPHLSLGWGSNRDFYPTSYFTLPHASIPFGDLYANPKCKYSPTRIRKTFLYKYLYYYFRARGKVILYIVSTGIIIILLLGGRTSYSRFKILIIYI